MMGVGLQQRKAHLEVMDNDHSLHVILGAGQIGSRLAKLLVAGGHAVRIVQRGRGAPLAGVEQRAGDMTDLRFAVEATRGAAVVYDCMNPPYPAWPTQLLPLGRGSLEGARRNGARLVALDCLYMYGQPSAPMNEATPVAPVTPKGELRAQLSALRLDAARRGDVALAIGRASDYFGPALPNSFFSDRFFTRILHGKAGECWGDPEQPHSYTYADDVASALVTLGTRPEAVSEGPLWMLPTAPAETTRQLVERLGRALDVDARVARVPGAVKALLGLFLPFVREVNKMSYQWEAPFVVDDAKFRRVFGQRATPVERQVAEVADWARRRFLHEGAPVAATPAANR